MRHTRTTIAIALIAAAGLAYGVAAQQKTAATAAALPKVTVYKTSSCGCCRQWVDHMKASGFDVQAMDVSSADVRAVSKTAGLKDEDTSCHTAKIGNYVVEGHVPAEQVLRLLKEKPKAKGLTVPAMPIGSPGMEQGATKQPYEVHLVHPDGTTSVYARY